MRTLIKYVYPRSKGDLEMWAESKGEAIRLIIEFYGVPIDPSRVVEATPSPQDIEIKSL